jgi:hypothetical protein
MCSSTNLLPVEAINTAEFIGSVDSLWDSFCGSGQMKMCKPLRRLLSDKSRHITFWNDAIEKIGNWSFVYKRTGQIKESMPFKTGT